MAAVPSDKLQSLSTYLDRLPACRGANRVSPSTATRWITRGVLTPAGRIRLRAVRVGNKWCTTDAWFEAFLAATTAAHLPADAADLPRSPAERRAAADAAGAELERLGV